MPEHQEPVSTQEDAAPARADSQDAAVPCPCVRTHRSVRFKRRDLRRLAEMYAGLDLNFAEQVRRAIEDAWGAHRKVAWTPAVPGRGI